MIFKNLARYPVRFVEHENSNSTGNSLELNAQNSCAILLSSAGDVRDKSLNVLMT